MRSSGDNWMDHHPRPAGWVELVPNQPSGILHSQTASPPRDRLPRRAVPGTLMRYTISTLPSKMTAALNPEVGQVTAQSGRRPGTGIAYHFITRPRLAKRRASWGFLSGSQTAGAEG